MFDLHDREWKEFRICDIFIIKAGKRLTKSDMTSGDKPFIGATDNNNGITEFVSNTNISEDCNVLGVNYNGSVVENFYHPYTCIFSDDVKRFQTKQVQGNKYIYLFMKTVILQQKCKYAYGYKFNEKRMQKQSLLLPVDESGHPDYAFMEQYIKEREWQIVQNYIDYIGNNIQIGGGLPALNEKKWKEFLVGTLFSVKRSKPRSEKQYEHGKIPFVASGNVNNGVIKCCTPNENEKLDTGNCITVSPVDGSAFYQEYSFLGRGGAGSSILMLYNPNINKYSGLFISRMIRQTCSKYSYGRMGSQESIKRERIMLPVDESGNPDYTFMVQYVKQVQETIKLRYLQEKMTVAI